jgi:hypothetical protein
MANGLTNQPKLGLSDRASAVITRYPRDFDIEQFIKIGPNPVHAMILHGNGRPGDWAPGSIEDLGISYNLITNGGKDYVAQAIGGLLGLNAGGSVTANTATSMGATSLTNTNATFGTNVYINSVVVAEEGTNTPVWGTIVSHSGTVLTIDAWKNGDGSAGTQPGATANYFILTGAAPAKWMAITENAGAANAADTSLTGEITTGGCGRALATYAHTGGTNTYTLTKAFSVTGTFPAVHKMGLFCHSTASTGPIIFETVLNADASVVNGDTLTITETVTLT